MRFEQETDLYISVIDSSGKSISTKSVEANLLFAILEKLEEIRCNIIDVEDVVSPPAPPEYRAIAIKHRTPDPGEDR